MAGFPSIVADEQHAGYIATKHLLSLGHRRIGCIVLGGDSTSSVSRAEGYRSALLEAGILPRKEWIVESEYGYAAGEMAAHTFLKRSKPPTAVVAHNDLMAIGAMKAFGDAGLKIPNDVSVVGFDDIAAASYVQPGLTTIAYPKRQMGEEAVEILLSLLGPKEKITPATRKLTVSLVVRESTAPPA